MVKKEKQNRRAYDSCQAKTDIEVIVKRLDRGAEKINKLNDDVKINRRYDKLILLIGIASFIHHLLQG